MNRNTSYLLALTVAGAVSLPASAQNLDHLNLADTTMAVVRNMTLEHLETELDAISSLLTEYEREKRDADHHKQLIMTEVAAIKKEIDILKTKSELAKKEERLADRDSLEAYRKEMEIKRDYYEDAANVRDSERRYAEALVEWTEQTRIYFEKAVQLMEERDRGGREHDLLTLEREVIEEQKLAAKRLDKVAGEAGRLASRREDIFNKREKLRDPD